jgi:hypothetical protein
MDRFTQEVGEAEAEIECRIAKMQNFVVEQHEASRMN